MYAYVWQRPHTENVSLCRADSRNTWPLCKNRKKTFHILLILFDTNSIEYSNSSVSPQQVHWFLKMQPFSKFQRFKLVGGECSQHSSVCLIMGLHNWIARLLKVLLLAVMHLSSELLQPKKAEVEINSKCPKFWIFFQHYTSKKFFKDTFIL